MPSDARRGVRRMGVGIVDQLLYNATNFVLTILVARSTTPREFGAFALIFTTWIICNSTCRGLTSETLVVRYSAATEAEWRHGAADGAGASAALGLALGSCIVVASFLIGGSMARAVLVIGIVLPGMFVQDYLRFAALSAARPMYAMLSDLAVAVAQFGAIVVLIMFHAESVPSLVAAWGGAGWVGAAVAGALLRIRPNPTRVFAWFRHDGDLAAKYAVDDLASNGGQQAPAYVVAAVSGLSGAGSLRGAQSVFGPPSILNLGVQGAVTPELVRVLQRSTRLLSRYVIYVGLGASLVGVAWGVGAMLCPTSVGKSLFGDTWALSRPLLVYFTVNQAAAGLRIAPTVGLRALGSANRTLVARLIAICAGITFATTGAILAGPKGVAIGIASGSTVAAVAYWWQFRLGLADYRRHITVQRRLEAWEELVGSTPSESRMDHVGRGIAADLADPFQQAFDVTLAEYTQAGGEGGRQRSLADERDG